MDNDKAIIIKLNGEKGKPPTLPPSNSDETGNLALVTLDAFLTSLNDGLNTRSKTYLASKFNSFIQTLVFNLTSISSVDLEITQHLSPKTHQLSYRFRFKLNK
jgi:hypothetical protein